MPGIIIITRRLTVGSYVVMSIRFLSFQTNRIYASPVVNTVNSPCIDAGH